MTKTKDKQAKGRKRTGGDRDRRALITELFMASPGQKIRLKTLAAVSGGADKEGRYATQEILRGMLAEGFIEKSDRETFKLSPKSLPSHEGVADMLASGSIYVRVEGEDNDIFVNQRLTHNALNGDRVRVVVTRRAQGSQSPEGEIIEIVERAKHTYVGVVEVSKNFAFLRPDSRKMPYDIYIRPSDKFELKNGQKIAARIVEWQPGSKNPVGEVVDVLGMAGDNDAEMHAILIEFNLPYKFEPEVETAAHAIGSDLNEDEYAKRRDMRGITTLTIDPTDAKDFDDALSIRPLREGAWEVGVHIADVTHYVTPGSVVDQEAQARATSVYLVDRTVPMQPERLSNELCSLRPDEDKLTFSAIFEMDDDGNILGQWLGRTVIRSDRRFSYDEVQAMIEGGDGEFKEQLMTLNSLARKMRAERFRNGAIAFESEEYKFDLDPNGKPLGVHPKIQKESNQLIEEFMLLANKTVAIFVGKKRGEAANAQRTMVYRVHDHPDADKLAKFRNFILRFGYYFKAEKGREVSREMNKLMAEIHGKAEENIISTLAIRSMAKAYYSTDNIGHYGLGFDFYTHFTSPIRRYPDMLVHRLLAHYLAGGKSPAKEQYEELCEHCSKREVLAAEAERASDKYKMVEFMLDKIGQQFTGVISGVTEWGIYVSLDETHIEGMAALRDMQDDYYFYDAEEYAIIGQRSRKKYTLGDKVSITMLRGDLARKQIDFALVTD